MITHNKPLEDKLIEVSNTISAKAREYDDQELRNLKEDFDWLIRHDIQSGSYDKKKARNEIRNMI